MSQKCINCDLSCKGNRRIPVINGSEELQTLIKLWVTPQTISDDTLLCLECWQLAHEALETNDHTRCFGHKSVCIGCGKSVLNCRSNKLVVDGIPNGKYYDPVSQWIAPKQIMDHHEICHNCYAKALRRVSPKKQKPKFSISNLCRVCLLENDNMLEIFDETSNLKQKIEFCTGLFITNDINKPYKICTTCNSDLSCAYIFKTNYIKSEERLSKFTDKKPVKRKETLSPANTSEFSVKKIKKEYEVELDFDNEEETLFYNEGEIPSAIENLNVKEEVTVFKEEVFNKEDGETSEQDTLDNDFDDTDDHLSKYFANESETTTSTTTAVKKQAKSLSLVLKTCKVCTKEFTTARDYSEHLRTHIKPIKCEQCDEVFFNYKTKRRHLLKHSVTIFACKHCRYKTHDKDRLVKHISITKHYTNWKPTCTVCKKNFLTEKKRNQHYREEHLYDMMFFCLICKKTVFEDEEKHMALHSAPKFECHDCDHKSYTKQNIEAHIMKIHLGIKEPKKRRIPKIAPHQRECEVCGSKFGSRQELLLHAKEHVSEYCICPVCGVKLLGSLKQHMDTAHSNKKYECHDCGRIYKSKSHVIRHIKNQHLNTGKINQCEICSKILSSSWVLNLHIRTVHMKEKNFKCLECGAMKFSQALLKQHMFKHNGIKDLKCELCESAFARITYLKNHMLKEHGVKVPSCKSGKAILYESSTDFIRSYLISIGRIPSVSGAVSQPPQATL